MTVLLPSCAEAAREEGTLLTLLFISPEKSLSCLFELCHFLLVNWSKAISSLWIKDFFFLSFSQDLNVRITQKGTASSLVLFNHCRRSSCEGYSFIFCCEEWVVFLQICVELISMQTLPVNGSGSHWREQLATFVLTLVFLVCARGKRILISISLNCAGQHYQLERPLWFDRPHCMMINYYSASLDFSNFLLPLAVGNKR